MIVSNSGLPFRVGHKIHLDTFQLHFSTLLLQPYLWKSGRMTLTLLKWGLGSPPKLPKLQSLIAGVKTPCIEAFFISLENYQNVDVENGLARAI